MVRNTFRKHEHLCGKLRIREVVTTGVAVHVSPFKLVGKSMSLPTTAPAQVGFAVPRRNLRHAVDRNRMKRLMREAYRMLKPRLYEKLEGRTEQVAWLFVFQGRTCIGLCETEEKISKALERWMEKHG
jgi:ribonuclease P protein component